MSLVTSLFHDAGYIASSTIGSIERRRVHALSRHSQRALSRRFLPSVGMDSWIPISTRIVHFTGYEIKLSQIQLADDATADSVTCWAPPT